MCVSLAIHRVDLMDCFRDNNPESPMKESFSKLFVKFLENRESWVHIIKVYTILHVALQDGATMKPIAEELKEREGNMFWYECKLGEREYRSLAQHLCSGS